MIQWNIARPYRVRFADGHSLNVQAYSATEAADQAAIEHPGTVVVKVEPDAPLKAGQLYVGPEGYARMMGIGPRCAYRWLARLEAAGLRRLGNQHGSRFRISEILELQDELASKG